MYKIIIMGTIVVIVGIANLKNKTDGINWVPL